MNDFEKAEESLNTILKYGDLYDAIALKEGVKVPTHTCFRTNVFLFSRILYGGVLLYDKIKSIFAPIKKVKNAQEQIRDILGFKVDVIKSKQVKDLSDYFMFSTKESIKPYLSILYESRNTSIELYIEQLRKILKFSELHQISEILLRETDITDSFPFVNLNNFKFKTMRNILNYEYINNKVDKSKEKYDIRKEISGRLLSLDCRQLYQLIKRLEVIEIDKNIVVMLSEKIEDISVLNAIKEFLNNENLEKLKNIVNQRLVLAINSDNSYKDKQFGKLYQNVLIDNQYVKVVSTDVNGEMVGNTVTTLYDYLEILDYQNLLEKTKRNDDNVEILRLASLYLYLCIDVKPKIVKDYNDDSFYDYIFKKYQEKEKHQIKFIPGLYSKRHKRIKRMDKMFLDFVFISLFCLTYLITGISFKFIETFVFNHQDSTIFEKMTEYIVAPYMYSFEFEKNCLKKVIPQDNTEILPNISAIGDVSKKKDNTLIATINKFSDDIVLPSYFARGYAKDSSYSFGQMKFDLINPALELHQFQNVESSFEIVSSLSEKKLKKIIENGNLEFLPTIYPIGGPYVLYSIFILDQSDDRKYFKIDCNQLRKGRLKLTTDEKELLASILCPEVYYEYGIDETKTATFVEFLEQNEEYSKTISEDTRRAIVSNLGLEENASIEEIYKAIQSKTYSKTPLKDAGLKWKTKFMNEKEYLETIASLDSLVCNMAAMLAVEVNEELLYVDGYLNHDDEYILSREAHAWAMKTDGTIVDLTPSVEAQKINEDIIKNIFYWGIEHDIPIALIMALIGYLVYKMYGDSVSYYFKLRKLEKILLDSNFDIIYAKLKEAIYGGINIPIKRDMLETTRVVKQEFSGFTLKELKELKEELKQSDLKKTELKTSLALIDEIPFIRRNYNDLEKSVQKRMKKNQF